VLEEQRCEACKAGAPLVSPDEQAKLLQQLPEWRVEPVEGVNHLVRSFSFANFQQALDFTAQVGAMAEAEDHHPAILTEWGRVRVEWWTHKIRGLHLNDFICAAKTDKIQLLFMDKS